MPGKRRIAFADLPAAIAIACGVYACAAGLSALLGWALDIQSLTDWTSQGISMFANTALCAMLAGIALIAAATSTRPAAILLVRLLASIVMVISGLTLAEHITGINFGIDTLLFERPWGQTAATAPMRMGPPASMSFFSLGIALTLATLGARARLMATTLAILTAAVASLSLVGYFFNADQLFGIARYTGIALNTSTAIAALSVGMMAAVPERGLVAALRRDDAGGAVHRRLLVPIIVVPLLLGWLRVMGQQAGLFDAAFGTALRSLLEVMLFFALLWWTAHNISWHAANAQKAHARLATTLESERLARSEAEKASRLKDEFLATLSHELRTPLSAILGWSHLLTVESTPADLEQGLEAIQRNAEAQTQLIEDLLDMSRIVSGKVRLDVQAIHLASVVKAAIESVRPVAEEKSIQIHEVVRPEAGFVSGDPTRLQQVVWNLLSNAIKFTRDGGRVDVLVERVDAHAQITVRDTGIGISSEDLPVIFERFRQADSSTTRRYSGLGLGLAIVKNLVELHGGTVRADSAGKGQGATFIVSLPSASAAMNESVPAAHPALQDGLPNDLAGVRVLVIDDEPDARELIARVLTQRRAEVCAVGSASEGLRQVEAFQPDVVVSDIAMPGMDGYQFIRAVRSLPPHEGGNIPAIALTAFARTEDHDRAILAGYQLHASKPIKPQELALLVQHLSGDKLTRSG